VTAERIVHILLEDNGPEVGEIAKAGISTWLLGRMARTPEQVENIRFGFSIYTSQEDIIKDNAKERGIKLTNHAWEQINKDISQLEKNAMKLLSQNGFIIRDEGHGDSDLVGSAWLRYIATHQLPDYVVVDPRALDVMKALKWDNQISTSSGTIDDIPGSSAIWKDVSEVGKQVLDVSISFFDVEKAEFGNWLELYKKHPQLWEPVTEAKELLDFNQLIGHPPPSGVFGKDVDGTMIYSVRCPGCKKIHGRFRTYDEASGNRQCKYCTRDFVDMMRTSYDTGNLKPLLKKEHDKRSSNFSR